MTKAVHLHQINIIVNEYKKDYLFFLFQVFIVKNLKITHKQHLALLMLSLSLLL